MAKKRRKAAKKSAKKESPSKKSDSSSGLYLTAIVGMVAVVAVVIMILNGGSGEVASFDESLALSEDLTGMAPWGNTRGGYYDPEKPAEPAPTPTPNPKPCANTCQPGESHRSPPGCECYTPMPQGPPPMTPGRWNPSKS